jgi:ABC-type branched-subunit amino acid transport system ATPase component
MMTQGKTADAVRNDVLLAARGVSVKFGGVVALNRVGLDVAAGTITGVVGPNGAGKSTLFAVLSGLLKPDEGHVLLRGRDISSASAAARARAGMARTFQQPQLFAGLTVRQHLQLAYRMRFSRRRLWRDLLSPRISPVSDADGDELDRCVQLLELLGIAPYADGSVLGLPLGVSRLVEVGRALASSPAIVLLDEPLAGLDSMASQRLIERLRDAVRAESATLLLVDHDFEAIAQLCRTIFVLDFGVVIASGPPAVIRELPEVQVAYLGDGIQRGPDA